MGIGNYVRALACAVVFAGMGAKAEDPGIHLERQGTTTGMNSIDEQLHRRMMWSHGAYLMMDKVGDQPPVFYTINREGAWTDRADFPYTGGLGINVFGYGRQSDGTIVFSGQTVSGPRDVSPFLAWISSDGKTQRMVSTKPYFPSLLAIAPDDSIWTLGMELVHLDFKDPAVNQQANALRHFDRKGKMLTSAFPQCRFGPIQMFRIGTGRLAATHTQVGWYGNPMREGFAAYTEFTLDGMTMKHYRDTPAVLKGTGDYDLAMTDSGDAALYLGDPWKRETQNYVLDRPAGKWVAVKVPPMGGYRFVPRLIGNDGDNLVFKYGTESGSFRVVP